MGGRREQAETFTAGDVIARRARLTPYRWVDSRWVAVGVAWGGFGVVKSDEIYNKVRAREGDLWKMPYGTREGMYARGCVGRFSISRKGLRVGGRR